MNVYRKIAFAFILFISLTVFAFWLLHPRGLVLEDWTMENGQSEKLSIPMNIELSESGLYTFETEFTRTSYDTLIIQELNGHAFKVYVNNQLVDGVGDFANPTANIWNYVHMIDLSSVNQTDVNTLRLEIYGLHDVGLNGAPYLTDKVYILPYVQAQNMFISKSNLMVIGAALTFSVLLLTFSIYSDHNKKVYLYYALALSLFSIYSTDLTFRETTGSFNTYFLIRKIQMLSLYLAVMFMILAARFYFRKKRTHPTVIISTLILLISIIIAPDFITLNQSIQFLGLLLPFSFIYIIIINFMDRYKRNIFASVFLALAVIYRVFEYAYNLPPVFLIQYAVLIYLVGVIYVLVADYSLLKEEKSLLHDKTTHDALTNVYNRNALNELSFTEHDALAFIDIDHFKSYNDTRGHNAGDQLLKEFSTYLRKVICPIGDIIRYGGDEFLIFIYDTNVNKATELIETIRHNISYRYDGIDFSYGITQCSSSLLDSIISADHKMYEMKFIKKEKNIESTNDN